MSLFEEAPHSFVEGIHDIEYDLSSSALGLKEECEPTDEPRQAQGNDYEMGCQFKGSGLMDRHISSWSSKGSRSSLW